VPVGAKGRAESGQSYKEILDSTSRDQASRINPNNPQNNDFNLRSGIFALNYENNEFVRHKSNTYDTQSRKIG